MKRSYTRKLYKGSGIFTSCRGKTCGESLNKNNTFKYNNPMKNVVKKIEKAINKNNTVKRKSLKRSEGKRFLNLNKNNTVKFNNPMRNVIEKVEEVIKNNNNSTSNTIRFIDNTIEKLNKTKNTYKNQKKEIRKALTEDQIKVLKSLKNALEKKNSSLLNRNLEKNVYRRIYELKKYNNSIIEEGMKQLKSLEMQI